MKSSEIVASFASCIRRKGSVIAIASLALTALDAQDAHAVPIVPSLGWATVVTDEEGTSLVPFGGDADFKGPIGTNLEFAAIANGLPPDSEVRFDFFEDDFWRNDRGPQNALATQLDPD